MDKQPLWSTKNSATLSLVLTYLCSFILLGCMVFAPDILPRWFKTEHFANGVMISFYVCCPMAIALVVCLIMLLTNIRKGVVFDEKNIKLLRMISWCCLLVAGITFAGTFIFFPPFFLVAVSAGFLGLILRVVKNVIAEACRIKQENDLTI